MRRALLALVTVACTATGARAQQATTAVVPESITVGDVFHAAVRVDVPLDAQVAFPDTLAVDGSDIETAGRVRIVADTVGGVRRVTATYPLTAWRTGRELRLPDVAYVVRRAGAVEPASAAFPSFTLGSVLPADTAGIEPKPAKDVWGANRVWWPWLLAAALLLAALVAFYLWRRRRTPVAAVVAPPRVAPREAALAALAHLRTAQLVERAEYKVFYSGITAAVRGYLEAVDGALGADLTTGEVAREVRRRGAPAVLLQLLRLLGSADLVKFARARPGATDAYADLDAAVHWVEHYGDPQPPVAGEQAA